MRAKKSPRGAGKDDAAKPLRADARRNRDRLLEVASALFVAEGPSVEIDEIARRAGVGVGTVYRHFPNKEDLFEAILVAHMERLIQDARWFSTDEDPGVAFYSFLAHVLDEDAPKKKFVDSLAQAGFDIRCAPSLSSEFSRELGGLLSRAQDAGSVRDDISVVEVLALLSGARVALEWGGGNARSRELLFEVLFQGLRRPSGGISGTSVESGASPARRRKRAS